MNFAHRIARKIRRLISRPADRIARMGHRGYIGGMWDEIGRLQFDFLIKNGLKPSDVFLDIACGSLRAGVHLIPYLDRGNYLGIDKEQRLIDAGLHEELTPAMRAEKAPEFIVSSTFEFSRFSKKPHYSIAQSLFTHLVPEHISLCLSHLRSFVDPGHVLYATFFDGEAPNPDESDDLARFYYTRDQMTQWGRKHGWDAQYIGDWNHPRGQVMMRYTAV